MAAVAAGRSGSDLVETIWTLFCSLRFAVVLNVALALAATLGTVIPQMQPGIQNFERELNLFIEGMRGRYGDLAAVLYWAGFFDVYNSVWFRMLVVLVVFSIIMCTMNRWQPIMRLIRRPAVRVSDAFIGGLSEKAQFRAVPLPVDAVESALRDALKKSRYRVLVERSDDGRTIHLYADRDRWSKLITFVSHGALVLLILAAVGMLNYSWREKSVKFYPGRPVSVGHDTDFQVRQDRFWIEYYPDGKTIKEYRNALTVIEGGKEVLSKTIVVNDPLRYKGVNYFLSSYQPLLYARATDAAGNNVGLKRMGASGLVTDTTASGETMVAFAFTNGDNLPMDLLQLPVGERAVTLQLTYYEDVTRAPVENPPVYVRAYLDKDFDKAIYDAFLPRTGELQLPGYPDYRLSFRGDFSTDMEVAQDPGLGLVVWFFMVMAVGFTISLYTTFARCWARIEPDAQRPGAVNVTVAGLAEKNKVSFERDFERLAERIKERLTQAALGGPASAGEQAISATSNSEP